MGERFAQLIIQGVLIALLLLAAGCSSHSGPHTFSTHTSYILNIRTTDPLTNATFYLPLPVKNGTPRVGTVALTPGSFGQFGGSTDIVRLSTEEIGNVTPVTGNESSWYLRVHVDNLPASGTRKTQFLVEIDNFTFVKTPLLFIDTVSPVGNEAVFLPEPVVPASLPATTGVRDSQWKRSAGVVSVREIPFYADYSTVLSNQVEIYSLVLGSNAWREWDDSGGYNNYQDSYDWHHTGEAHGWQNATGEFICANGVYPNLSHPVWQAVISPTATQ
ncbi:hypothetical protein [Methanoregula formicica]|uniref:Uncharacterized protein n=1 Tax=Methanoregula formicica (strain DSM 22288 / NBRC 105244 / SMSP) TaxID=593750 RepID=L0HHR7_METFS|nr:hypothetical protein [Methanoregula formicica]AGB02868.1 hypothetical protein Metfor_1845 [Methanoregula formicica SMSP]